MLICNWSKPITRQNILYLKTGGCPRIYLKRYFPIFKPYIQYGKLCDLDLIQDGKGCVVVIEEGTCFFCSQNHFREH